ncbi:proteasome-activating nucleotidase [Polyplosphaeria fusca]|uniref:Proteasome-activating nucleotidase n=1 Tax=Polyplosphaeria fusca TaxID=682080 RepID=A0A9P4R2M3_9PLEO|nr:proteasome-activating nucleotidase [Polyplosphaeria fusca]
MPAAKNTAIKTSVNDQALFESFKEHCFGKRIDTKTTALNLLRKAYPDHHVTETSEAKASLIEFSEAGKAVVELKSEPESFNATREWKPVGERIEKKLHPGKLTDDFRFAGFKYVWEEKEYLVYNVAWKDFLDPPQHMFYVLYPRQEANIVSGHCTETDELLLVAGKWTSQLHEEIWVFDNSRWEKSKDLWKAVDGSSWNDVILDPDMKKNIIEDVQSFFDNQQLYAQYAVPWKRGIILHGVPGNGKTVSIKALMSSLYARPDQIPSLYVKSLEDKCQGPQYSVRQIFHQARQSAPCLLIFEDLDSLVSDEVRSYFLNEVDGLESNDGILMIGSTNHLDKLDPAISKRPSRFDRKYQFKIPGEKERIMYAEYWRNKLLKNQTVDFPEELCTILGKLTEGFSFAYLKELFVMALLSLVRGVKSEDFEMVDADTESEIAGEENPSKPGDAASKDDAEKSAEAPATCTCSKTCKDCGKLLEAAAKKAADVEEEKEEAKKNKMVMPRVEIPDALADNMLLKVIKHQIRTLQAEMDNTKEDEWLSGKKGMSVGVDTNSMWFQLPARRR